MRHMRPLWRLAVPAILLVVGACADTGPTTSAQIGQDIRTGYWMQNQMPPAGSGALPFSTFDDITTVGP
jgi:hypothetical protein